MASVRQFVEALRQTTMRLARRISPTYVVIAIAIVYGIGFSLLSLSRYNNFMNYIDLGSHTQALFTTAFDGRLLYQNFEALNTIVLEGRVYFGSYLGVHFAPLLLLLVPVFYVFPTPITLLTLKSIFIGLSVIPAFYIARNMLDRKAAFFVTALYILNPALHTLTLADFQAQAFFPLFILSAIYFLMKKKYVPYYITLILSLMTMEFMSVLVASFAFVELLFKKSTTADSRIHLKTTFVIAIVWFVVANMFMSIFKPQGLSVWGSLLSGGALHALSYRFFEKAAFLLLIMIPFGFLPLQSPYILALLPWVGITITSLSPGMFQLGWHYGAYFVPFLFMATIDVLHTRNVKASLSKSDHKELSKMFIVSCLIVSIVISPLNPLTIGNLPGVAYSPKPFDSEHIEFMNNIIGLIPDNATVLAQTPISQHLATRLNTYVYVPSLDAYAMDYIIADSRHWDFTYFDFDRVMETAINSGKYGILAYGDGILLLKRGYIDQPMIYRKLVGVFGYSGLISSKLFATSGTLVLEKAFDIIDPTSKSQDVIMYDASSGWGDVVWYGPRIWLMPGIYNVTFVLKVDPGKQLQPDDYLLTLDVASRSGHVFAEKQVYGVDVPGTGKWFNLTLSFALDKIVEDVEFRGLNAGTINFYLDYIELDQISQSYKPVTFFTFNYEDLFLGESEIVGNIIVHRQNNGTMWSSPLVLLHPGNYTAKFWLRLDDMYGGHVIDIEAANQDLGKLGYARIYSGNFTSVGSWQPFKIRFTLDSDENVKFTGLNVENDVKVSLLYIEVQSGY